jgi:phosphate starvation-inducible PhoH-like protein
MTKRKDRQAERTVETSTRRADPRTPNQVAYAEALRLGPVVLGLGPAGTGKTMLACAEAVRRLNLNLVDRIVLARPIVPAGEEIGFLPGEAADKVAPFMAPLYDCLSKLMGRGVLDRSLAAGVVELAPLAFMRGRTFERAVMILDEAQNASPEQIYMFLTRLGVGSVAFLTGDPNQCDVRTSGLGRVLRLSPVTVCKFDIADCQRHDVVARIMEEWVR